MRSVLESQALAQFVFEANPGANQDNILNIPADAEQYFVIDWIAWSYDITPTGGYLQVQYNSVPVFELDITAAGPGMLTFDPPLHVSNATKGQAVDITLGAGGGGCTGKLNVRYR